MRLKLREDKYEFLLHTVLSELKYFATNSPYGNGELTAIMDDKPPGKNFELKFKPDSHLS